MLIDLLYFEGCPSWRPGLENLSSALDAEGMHAEIRLVSVDNNTEGSHFGSAGTAHLLFHHQDQIKQV